MKLFAVDVEFTMVVAAEDYAHAVSVAEEHAREAIDDCMPSFNSPRPVRRIDALPGSWDGMCLPYGGDGSTRIKDVLGETTA